MIGSFRASDSRKTHCFSSILASDAEKQQFSRQCWPPTRLCEPTREKHEKMHFHCRGVAKCKKCTHTLARARKKFASRAGREADFAVLQHPSNGKLIFASTSMVPSCSQKKKFGKLIFLPWVKMSFRTSVCSSEQNVQMLSTPSFLLLSLGQRYLWIPQAKAKVLKPFWLNLGKNRKKI